MIDLPLGVPVRDGFFTLRRSYDPPKMRYVYGVFMSERRVCACAVNESDLNLAGGIMASLVDARLMPEVSHWLASNIVWC